MEQVSETDAVTSPANSIDNNAGSLPLPDGTTAEVSGGNGQFVSGSHQNQASRLPFKGVIVTRSMSRSVVTGNDSYDASLRSDVNNDDLRLRNNSKSRPLLGLNDSNTLYTTMSGPGASFSVPSNLTIDRSGKPPVSREDSQPVDNGRPQELWKSAYKSLRGRLKNNTKRNWALGTLGTYVLGLAITGGTLALIGKGAVLTAIFAAAGGPVGAVIGIAVTLALIEVGAFATSGGWKFGEWLGDHRARNLHPFGADVGKEVARRIDANLSHDLLPTEYDHAIDETLTTLKQSGRFQNLGDGDWTAIRSGMDQHLQDQLRYFKQDYSLLHAEDSLTLFGRQMATEISANLNAGDANYQRNNEAYQEAVRHARNLIAALGQVPQPTSTQLASLQSKAVLAWNRYANLTGQPFDRTGGLAKMLRGAELQLSNNQQLLGGMLRPANKKLGKALKAGMPARELCVSTSKLKNSVPEGNTTAIACDLRNELLDMALQQAAPHPEWTELQHEFPSLAAGKGWSAPDKRPDQPEIFKHAAAVAGQVAAFSYLASLHGVRVEDATIRTDTTFRTSNSQTLDQADEAPR